ncbi:IucA/IucC family protein [Marinimicrobium agarilyticum]|uniref:IucA/IucC family protein n=1 Tax=Marinimicrobium agarilyticum TaxID=306546 RepID=UPI00041BEE57|nr:IucA/IucC family protein [Marinimicrobium agarilyticum]
MSEAAPSPNVEAEPPVVPETPAERVFRQALEAALFEGLIDYVLVPAEKTLWETLYFSLGRHDYRCAGRLRGFGRVRLNTATLSRVHAVPSAVAPEEMLPLLLDALPGDEETRRRFERELVQTRQWCEWNERHLPPLDERRCLPLAQLEMAMREGHPYHPCFKARIGFSERDHQQYSPEAGTPVRPHWIAVPREQVVTAGAASRADTFWRNELGDAGYQNLLERARVRGLDPESVTYVPVHPWQWQMYLAQRCQKAPIQAVDLGQPGDEYWVSQSVRTLMNRTHPEKADLKLPLGIVNTSAPRHLLSHGIESGPRLSRWIAETVERDQFFQKHPLVILREYAGLRVADASAHPDDDPEVCGFGALWRESLIARQKATERAAPLMALALIEADGRPFIDLWVQRYGLEAWLRQLFRTLILPVWHLVARHGIALEAHGQNTLLLHENGWPVRVAARDFHESVEYVEDFLAEPDRAPAFSREARYAHAKPNQYYWMTSVEALRELVMDTLFVFHLSELALLCEEHYRLPESRFWSLVAECLEGYRNGGHCRQERLDLLGYQSPMIQVESLLRKKLCSGADEYHHRVFNPLAHANQPSFSHKHAYPKEVPHAVLPR